MASARTHRVVRAPVGLRRLQRVLLCAAAWAALTPTAASTQIRVNPDGVNVNSQGATSVFLTFGGLAGHVPVEAFWCGELIPADPDVGLKCDPSTIFGRLPLRYDQSTLAGNRFTDIMSIPPSVARRAYQAAEAGQTSSFFYVRRFESTTGGPDEFVPVTCRMAGGGARVPFSLVDVRLEFDVDAPILFLRPGQVAPALAAEITYNGTGRLKGRWEVVLPGEELPSERDLLTEATLPPEERGTQRRYTQLERFNVFLPPGGRTVVPGPDPTDIPTSTEGVHLILLRVEATDDKEGDSNLASAGAGTGIVHSGAVAGFPLPTLRYIVGSGGSELALRQMEEELVLLLPADRARVPRGPFDFTWGEVRGAAYYRLDVRDSDGGEALSAIVPAGAPVYRAPPWLPDRLASDDVTWRVAALDLTGEEIRDSGWRRLTIGEVAAAEGTPAAAPAAPPGP